MNPNRIAGAHYEIKVVICFDFIIFALWIPTFITSDTLEPRLWFASILLFLHYESQRRHKSIQKWKRCDLLRFYYFCIMNPNACFQIEELYPVVICFDFIIFALWIPTSPGRRSLPEPLWFASILLFLHYESQPWADTDEFRLSCDLLRFYYFCIMNPNLYRWHCSPYVVVICFDFIIFALWIPTGAHKVSFPISLWFASILLFLHYESQH